MSKTFTNGLRLLEAVNAQPRSISELAELLAVDKATVSRLVRAAEADGWVEREGRLIRIGARAALLGQHSPVSVAARSAEALVHAVAGVTGGVAQAVGLVGQRAVVIAIASGPGPTGRTGMAISTPLWLGAAGKVIASQINRAHLAQYLPAGSLARAEPGIPEEVLTPYRDRARLSGADRRAEAASTRAGNHRQLLEQLAEVRRHGICIEHHEVVEGISCHAVPWPQPGLPAALVAIGPTSDQIGCSRLISAVLREAARPHATTADVVAAAAAAGPSANGRRPAHRRQAKPPPAARTLRAGSRRNPTLPD